MDILLTFSVFYSSSISEINKIQFNYLFRFSCNSKPHSFIEHIFLINDSSLRKRLLEFEASRIENNKLFLTYNQIFFC